MEKDHVSGGHITAACEMLEELDDIRAYDEAKSGPSEPVGFEQAVSEIREGVSN